MITRQYIRRQKDYCENFLKNRHAIGLVCKRRCFPPTLSWIKKVWNPVNTGNRGTGWPFRKVIFDFLIFAVWHYWYYQRTNLYIVLEWCYAVTDGSSFIPAGPGCGESGKTQVRPQRNPAHSERTLISKPCTIGLVAGVASTQQVKCSQNSSKITLVFSKVRGGDMRSMSKLKPSTTSPLAQMFHTILLWQFNYSVSWLHYCLFASVK